MANFKSIKIFSGNANRPLAEEIAQCAGVSLGQSTVKQFSDGETWVEILENVRGMDVFAVQPTSYPANQNLMELLIMIDALKRASADRITAVMPYYGYARQERKVAPRTPISAKLVADLLTAAGANRILAMELHVGQIQGFFNIPVDHLFSMPVILPYLRTNIPGDIVIVAPDAGGTERARAYAKRLTCPMALIDKRRPAPNVTEIVNIIGEVAGKTAVIVDDMIDTAGTLAKSAQTLMANGATAVYACATHGVFSGKAMENIAQCPVKEVLVCNTIASTAAVRANPKIKVLSVASLLAEAMKRIYQSDSISSLFV